MNVHPECKLHAMASFVALCLFSLLPSAHAATVLQLGMADLVDDAELIIHGRVIEGWTSFDDQRNTVFTNIRIAIDEVIKGPAQNKDIVLQFEGGKHGRLVVSVGGMNVPIVGEEGVYFVENPDRVQINPLLGWQQGHFVVRYDGERLAKHVYTHDLRPVYGVSAESRDAAIGISSGVPLGLRTESFDDDAPMSLTSFKDALRALVEERQ